MHNLDEQFLKDVGVADLPEDMKAELVEGLEKQIQDRISLRMAEVLSDEQLDAFAGIGADEQTKWLEENVPDFREIVEDTLREVKEEILAQKAQALGN
ncbi:DUF5663 domain-containing protein [Candidatus Saccharibacteria bacterium]|nr:DUF5663 domain-containing protein [Candidatus Saccharibacteria bacterium]